MSNADLYFREEREGPSNTVREGRRTLGDMMSEKVRAAGERLEQVQETYRKAAEEQARMAGNPPPPKTTIRVRPAKQYAQFGVNTASAGKIIGEQEVEPSSWIMRRIRDGSLELVEAGAAPQQQEQPPPDQQQPQPAQSPTGQAAPPPEQPQQPPAEPPVPEQPAE